MAMAMARGARRRPGGERGPPPGRAGMAGAGGRRLLLLLALAAGAPGCARALGALARDPRRVVARNAFPGFHNEELRATLAYELEDLPGAGLTPALVPSLERPGHDVLVVTLTEEPGGQESEAETEAEARGCVVLYAHGNAETVLRAAPKLARVQAETGCRVVAVEYTGYGAWRQQAARPSETALRDDIETAAAWVVSNFPDLDLFLWGWSMGSGAVVAAARRDRAQIVRRLPPDATQPHAWSRLLLERDPLKGLILESPYLSVLRSRTGSLPGGGLLRGILRGQDMFDNREGLQSAGGVPLLVLAGSADEVIPADQARKLHSEYNGADKSLLVLPGAGHNNLGDWPYATFFWPRVRRFVHRLSPDPSGEEPAPEQQAGWLSGGGDGNGYCRLLSLEKVDVGLRNFQPTLVQALHAHPKIGHQGPAIGNGHLEYSCLLHVNDPLPFGEVDDDCLVILVGRQGVGETGWPLG